MKLVISLLISCSLSIAQTITSAEYFWDDDPGAGNGTALALSAADSVTVGTAIPPSALEGLHALYVRFQSNSGIWSKPSGNHIYLFSEPAYTTAVELTEADILANGNVIATLDVPDTTNVLVSELLSELGLPVGLHLISVRYHTNNGTVTEAQGDYLYYFAEDTAYSAQRLTEARIRINGQSAFTMDFADSALVPINELLALDSLAAGLHKIQVEFTAANGLKSSTQGIAFYFFNPDTGYTIHKIVEADILLDDLPVGVLDLPDSSISGQGVVLGTDSLSAGGHKLGLKFYDQRGITSGNQSNYFFLFAPHVPLDSAYLVAAEYYVNVDPGEGNGIQLVPDDGLLDSLTESFGDTLNGLPLGLHFAGFRMQDNRGIWSETQIDSFLIAPLLTVMSSGNDIILRWQFGDNGGPLMHVERAANTGGPYTEIASTSNASYTDTGILTTTDRAFYQIKQDLSVRSNFRLPNNAPPSQ